MPFPTDRQFEPRRRSQVKAFWPSLLRLSAVVWGCALAAPNAHAQCTYFVEGDSFFRFELTQELAKQFAEAETIDFSYRCSAEATLAGVEGSDNCRITGLDAASRRHVSDAIEEISGGNRLFETVRDKNGKVVSEQPKPLGQGFLVPKTYDFARYGIGFRYNENWMDHSWSYQPHFRNKGLIPRDWACAARVDPLPLRPIPRKAGDETWKVLSAPWDQLQLVLTGVVDMDELATADEGGETVFVIRGDGIHRFMPLGHFKWEELPPVER